MNVFEITKAKINDIDISDEEIQMALDEVEVVILNYCAIYDVPNELMYTWANMSADLIRYQFVSGGNRFENLNNVSSVKVGDTTVDYTNDSSVDNTYKALSSHLPILDNIVLNYGEQLKSFRKIKW